MVVVVSCIIGGIILLALLMMIIYLVTHRKKPPHLENYFTGNLVADFIDYKSYNEARKLQWRLDVFHGRVNFKQLFLNAGIKEIFHGADRIWLYPKNDLGIELIHSTSGSVFVGNRSVPKDTFVTVYPGEKFYIGFEDNGVELEFRYDR